MRIALDASPLGKHKDGVARYAYNLAKHLPAAAPRDRFFLFSNRDFDDAGLKCPNLEKVVAGFPVMSFWLQTIVPYYLKKLRIDLFHGTYFVVPWMTRVPSVVSVHDLTPFIYRKSHQRSNFLVRRLLPLSLARAKLAITGSRSAACDLMEHLGCDEGKIRTVPYAADDRFRPVLDAPGLDRVKAKYCIPPSYILFLGTVEPRKNVETLIEAFASIKRAGEIGQKLVVAGRRTDYCGRCESLARRLNIGGEVVFTGFVEEEDMPGLYGGADLFVYPSFYEGFGLPPLEAMACGVPTIVSEGSSFPEVVGDGAMRVPAEDAAKLSEAMLKALSDDELRRRLRAEGLERARSFSWHETALGTLSVYREIVQQ